MIRKKEPNPIDKHVGSRVRMRRMMLGMSQEKLGDALGVTFQQVQKNEKGTNRIGASRVQQLAQILKVDPAFFFEGAPLAGSSPAAVVMDDPHSPSADLPSAFLTNAHGLRLMRAFMRFPTSNIRGRFAEMAEEIADACGAREAPPLRKTG